VRPLLLLLTCSLLHAGEASVAFPLDPLSKQAFKAVDAGRTYLVPAAMVLIPAGPFKFGTEGGGRQLELPAYGIGRYPVTNAEFEVFVRSTGAKAPSHWTDGHCPAGKENHPVLNISLVAAKAYAEWATSKTGFRYAIPTAPQWEKAARGPKGTLYPWGDSADVTYRDGVLRSRFNFNAVIAAKLLKEAPERPATYDNRKSTHFGERTTISGIASYDGDRSDRLAVLPNGQVRGWVGHATYTGFIYTDIFTRLNQTGGNTTPVGAYEDGKSAYGCYDMAGNVWNWCDTVITAKNGLEKGREVNEVRGGSWYATAMSCKSVSIGEGRVASGAYNTVGFRLVVRLGD